MRLSKFDLQEVRVMTCTFPAYNLPWAVFLVSVSTQISAHSEDTYRQLGITQFSNLTINVNILEIINWTLVPNVYDKTSET